MHVRHPPPPTAFVSALLAFFLTGTGAALAEQYCFPHCDYTHYYGPLDFSYIRPGLFGYPRCGPQGDCAPQLAYTTGIPRGRITVRFPRVMIAPQQR
jgi:hypothetical protein